MNLRRHILDYGHVVFDWNGTIVDDAGLALHSVNRVRADIGLDPIDSETYRRLFRFPISEFYQELGFDFGTTPFADLVSRYLGYFDAAVADCDICSGFHELAASLKTHHISISVLSASHQETLARIAHRKAIAPLVDNLFGLGDQAAAGKMERARELDRLIAAASSGPVLMIGDTDHDHDVARDRGWDFVAIASGHQDRIRLERLGGAPVFDDLGELMVASRLLCGADRP